MRKSDLFFTLLGLLLSFLVLSLSFFPPKPYAPQKPTILLITIDTLRTDHLGCYGYRHSPEPITPHIDDLAKKGFQFDHCFVQCPITLPSHTSILTGLNPSSHGVRDNLYYALEPSIETLAETLQKEGYECAAILGAYPLKRSLREGYGLQQGFDVYDDEFQSPKQDFRIFFPERRANEVTDLALTQLRKHRKKPLFLWVHYFDPHANYTPPQAFNRFPSTRGTAYDGYAGEVHFTDFEIGRLMKEVDKTQTLTILTADHAEGLGEHGESTHAYFLYDSTLHVPLIFNWEGQIPSGRTSQQVRSIDITPTLLNLLNFKAPPMDGISLKKLLQNLSKPFSEPESYGETFYCFQNFNWNIQRSLRNPSQKYIEGLHETGGVFFELLEDPEELEPKPLKNLGMAERLESYKKQENSSSSSSSSLEWDERYAGPYWSIPPRPLEETLKKIPQLPLIEKMNNALNEATLGDYPKALDLCESLLIEDSENMAMLKLKAKLLSTPSLGRYKEAVPVFQWMMNLRPEMSTFCFHGIIDNFIKLKKFESAKIELQKMEKLEQEGKLQRDSTSYNFYAFLFLEENLPEKALEYTQKSLALRPGNAIGSYYHSQACFRLSRISEGITSLKHCLTQPETLTLASQTQEEYLQELLKKGLLALQERQYPSAELLFQSASELGDDLHAPYYWGLALAKNHKKKEAVEILQALVQRHPHFADAYFYLGILALDHEDYEKGIAFFSQYLTHFDHVLEDQRQEISKILQELKMRLPGHPLEPQWNHLLSLIPHSD
jgi:arylsulfatase A-like enzyme/predicted Zn-dependent protease